jgi:hypothetical protein
MTRKQNNLILIGIAVVVITLSVFSFLNRSKVNDEVSPQIVNTLIEPYKQALNSGDYERAYSDFTSEEYREKYTLDTFMTIQNQNREYYGKINRLEPVSGLFLPEMKRKYTVYKGTLAYQGERSGRRIVMEVVKEDGEFKINKTYLSMLSVGNEKAIIF